MDKTVVDEGLLDAIDTIKLSARFVKFRDDYIDAKPHVCTEVPKIAMESWQCTEGEDLELRWAKLVASILENVPISINDGELIVGSETKYIRGAYPFVHYDAGAMKVLVDRGKITMGTPVAEGVLTDEERDTLVHCIQYFGGRTAGDLVREVENVGGTWYRDVVDAKGALAYEWNPCFEAVPMFGKLLASGLQRIIEEAESNIQKFVEERRTDLERLWFWQSVIIVCNAVITFAKRHAQLARELGTREQDAKRGAELEEIAQICDWVPENPARTFHEAIQFVRIIDVALRLENPHEGTFPGRIDQYLYPYFKRDLERGILTLEKASELVGDFIIHLAREEKVSSVHAGEVVPATTVTNLTLGGVTKEGKDAYNELTHLFLHMAGLLRFAEPHISFAFHTGTSHLAVMKALETNLRIKGGNPQFINGDHLVDYFMDLGFPLEEARDWAAAGCTNTMPQSAASDVKLALGHPNLALVLDVTLHNGIAPVTGKRIGLETGDPREFKTFDELYEAYTKQLEFYIKKLVWYHHLTFQAEVSRVREPLLSSVLPNCVANGKDFLCGGLGRYPLWDIRDRGFVDTGDSLAAIKKLVFDDKKLTMDELLKALDSNFEGERGEEIRELCLKAPKFGNGISEADSLVRDVSRLSASIITSLKNPYGEPYSINRNGVAWHIYGGKGVGALPNGRKALAPLNDGSLSPMPGMDTHGPTAVLKSVLTADFAAKRQTRLGVLNQRFPISLFQAQEPREKLVMLTETFLRNGGTHIQYNLLDHTELLEAKKHPEKYKDLIVRVGGYSAYFVTLAPEVQDEIIRRTEQKI